jgi:hypothetical protein
LAEADQIYQRDIISKEIPNPERKNIKLRLTIVYRNQGIETPPGHFSRKSSKLQLMTVDIQIQKCD